MGGDTTASWEDEFRKHLSRLSQWNQQTPAPRMAIGMTDGSGENEFVFIRGNHKNLGKQVPRKLIDALDPEGQTKSPGSGRAELAEKLIALENPLTRRVIVNRLWHHIFGRGLVASIDNFGVLGEKPSHPELLDFLATQFVEDQWSIKKTLRRMVLSQTYRMSSKPVKAAAETDPENLLLSSMRQRRLQGEVIRDSLLSVSGELNPVQFGPSVPIHLTPFMQGRGRPGQSGPLDGNNRRSIYVEVRRNFLHPMMLAFDTPVPFNAIGRRTSSNVPAQALILMNDPFVILQANKWAEKLVKIDETTDARLKRIYLRAFSRPPTEFELAKAKEFLSTQAEEYSIPEKDQKDNPRLWADLCHVMFNVKEFIYIR